MIKAYLIHLQYDVWSSQCWFLGEDSPEAEQRWLEARKTLPQAVEGVTNPLQFSQKAAEHFKSYGFDRVHK